MIDNYVVLTCEDLSLINLNRLEGFFSKLESRKIYSGENENNRTVIVIELPDDLELHSSLDKLLTSFDFSNDFSLQVKELKEKGYLPRNLN